MPSADSRPTVRMDRSTLSHDAVTCGGSPEVSSTAFDAQPPDLPPVCLVETGFAVLCQLAPHRRPHHPVLVHRLAPLIHASFRPRLATTPLRFSSPSPPPDWAGDFHPQAVEHVRHTKQKPPGGGFEDWLLFYFYCSVLQIGLGNGGLPPLTAQQISYAAKSCAHKHHRAWFRRGYYPQPVPSDVRVAA